MLIAFIVLFLVFAWPHWCRHYCLVQRQKGNGQDDPNLQHLFKFIRMENLGLHYAAPCQSTKSFGAGSTLCVNYSTKMWTIKWKQWHQFHILMIESILILDSIVSFKIEKISGKWKYLCPIHFSNQSWDWGSQKDWKSCSGRMWIPFVVRSYL